MPQQINEEEEREIRESLDLLRANPGNPILVELGDGDVVITPRAIFDDLIKELNESRIKLGNLENGVELISVSEEE